MAKRTLHPFNVEKVELEGANLIEASAGTGKTYSIAILVLRMILEKEIHLKEILMVTFTNAAVAELEGRVREFIRLACSYASGDKISEELIRSITNENIKTLGRDQVEQKLKDARRQLDETSIFTIHSFCQQILVEYAFETGQQFSSKVIEDQTRLIEKWVNEFWRQSVTSIEPDILAVLIDNELSRLTMIQCLKKALSGKRFIYKDMDIEEAGNGVRDMLEDLRQSKESFYNLFRNSPEKEPENVGKNKNAVASFGDLTDNAEGFRKQLIEKSAVDYVPKLFPVLRSAALNTVVFEDALTEAASALVYLLYGRSIDLVIGELEKTKQDLSLFSYDDLIYKLHIALESAHSQELIVALRKKYKAGFIDEFQDTDRLQYEIFSTIFDKDSIAFFIGDPKQSIYGFRGADIDTYKAAADQVEKDGSIFTMKQNFRSTAKVIEAYNTFFGTVKDPFNDPVIQYENVSAALKLPELAINAQESPPLSLVSCSKNEEIYQQVAYRIHLLLTTNYIIQEYGENRRVRPSDFGILVRTKITGKEIKKELSRLSIPSITIDDTKVTKTEEAKIIAYILKAIIEPDRANINRALLSKVTTKTKEDLLNPSDESDLDSFKVLQKIWNEKGVYSAINKFMQLYQVRSSVYENQPDNPQRCISNILQISELLHNREIRAKLTPNELINWLLSTDSNDAENDSATSEEFMQRLESDEDAVQIVTIHKSKGLAYNIVVAPDLDMKSEPKYDPIEYKNQNTGEYCFSFYKTPAEESWYREQAEQENRRMIYVALTRAVYKCFIFHNTGTPGSIANFISEAQNSGCAEFCQLIEKPEIRFQISEDESVRAPEIFMKKVDRKWQLVSFSHLNDRHQFMGDHIQSKQDNYSNFVFNQLPGGPLAGNFLHSLFEFSDFQKKDFVDVIKLSGKQYPSVYNKANSEMYHELIHHTLQSKIPIPGSFRLSDIPNSDKIPELEFFFSLKEFSPTALAGLAKTSGIMDFGQIKGMMHGFVDLLFRHEDKYYILDWKSNKLGSKIEDYNHERMEDAIHANNYHVQYLIYTLAVKRFLEVQLQNFDYRTHFGGVIYVFLRGCREGDSSGIYYTMPEVALVNQLEDLMI
jgi:exodeoxyribonuclease V beta subunit